MLWRALRLVVLLLFPFVATPLWATQQPVSAPYITLCEISRTGANRQGRTKEITVESRLGDQINEGIDWNRNIAFIALDLEGELNKDSILFDLDKGPVTMQDAYSLLERLFVKAKETIEVKQSYTEEEAQETCLIIHGIFEREGFKYKDFSSWEYCLLGANLFSYGLARRELNCFGYVILYLGIAERLGLPLVAINVPGHLAVRWHLGAGRYFNWETTVPSRCEDRFYISWKNISEAALRSGVYIKSEGLSKKQVAAHVYYNKGLVLKERRQFDKSRIEIDKSIELFGKYADAYNLRGIVWKVRGKTTDAIGEFDKALGLAPNFSEAYYNRADAKSKTGDYEGYKRDLTALKTLDPDLAKRLEYLTEGM